MNFKAPFILCFLISILGYGQEFSLSGNVMDEKGQPIPFANVILMTQKDSTIVKGTSTGDDGFFFINQINNNNYSFKISYIGYKDFLNEISVDQNINLGTITLIEEVQSLDEISIVFKRPTFKKEADKLVFNVENTALIEGNILQVLKSTPGVLVISNAITVKNTTPTVYINDKKVNLSASEITQLLESSSANAIKSVEVITNPSAKYDASSGVVLNIIMSKNLVTGYRGNLFSSYDQGVFGKYNVSTSHFFKSEKINLYANYSYTDSKMNRDDTENINYFNENLTVDEYWVSETNRNKWEETHNLNLNFDYAFDDQNTLSLSSNVFYLPHQKYIKSNFTNIFDATKNLDFYYDSNNFEIDKKHNVAFDIDFTHQFSKGNLNISSHFTDYSFNQSQKVDSEYFDSDNSFLDTTAFNTQNLQDTNIYAAQSDYSLPIDESSIFETGLKTSYIKTNSGTTQYDIINGQEVLDANNTDEFNYKESVHAVYANYSKDGKKWSLILGLRIEQTNIKSTSVINSETNKQDYLKWFPTTSISFKPNENFSLYTNYKRSIVRPDYHDLNPFRFYYNDNNLFVGNPNLQPVIEDQVVIGTSFLDHFVIEAYYKNQKNKFYVLPLQDNGTKIFTYSPLNFEKTREYGLDFSVNFNPLKDWTVDFLTSFYNIESKKKFENNNVKLDQWSNFSVLQNDFTFLKDRSLNVNVTMYYAGRNLQGFRLVEEMLFSSLSISKSIINNKAVISLSAEDLFNTQDWDYSTQYLNQFSKIHLDNDQRRIKLGFRYNFGNTNLRTNSRTKSLEERDRLIEK